MMKQKANELMGAQVVASAIHAADAVRITIGDEANIMRVFFQVSRAASIVLLDRLWIDAAEERIMLAVQRGNFAGRARQQLFEATRSHSKQRFVRKLQLRFRDQLEVHQLLQRRIMGRTYITGLNRSTDSVYRANRVPIQETFNRLAG